VEAMEWEKPHEFDYRKELVEISQELHQAFVEIEEVAKQPEPDYTDTREKFIKCQKKANNLTVPTMYEKAHAFLLQALESHNTGINVLVEAVPEKDVYAIRRAARYMQEGASYIQLAQSKMFEAIEQRQSKKVVH